jgi:hypothetical protein
MQAQLRINAAIWLLDAQGTAQRQIHTLGGITLDELPLDFAFELPTSRLAPGLYGIAVVAAESLTNVQVLNVKFPALFEVLAELPEEPEPEFKFFLGQLVCSGDKIGNIVRLPTTPGGRYIVRWAEPPEIAGDERSAAESSLDDCSGGLPELPEPPEEPEEPRQQFSIGDLVFLRGSRATTWVITDTRLRNNSWQYFIDVERGKGGNPGWVRENDLSLVTPPPTPPPTPAPTPAPTPPPEVPPEAPPPKFDIGDRVFLAGSRATIWMVSDSEFRDDRWFHFITFVAGKGGNEGWVPESLLSPE